MDGKDDKNVLGAQGATEGDAAGQAVPDSPASHAALAKAIIDAIPGALGITPDPWPEEPDERDGEPHRTVARLLSAHELDSIGVRLIAAERARQQAKEGFTAASDNQYTSSVLALAGASYALHAAGVRDARQHWPFNEEWWKPSTGDPIRDLTKAGALIAAEIDRLSKMRADLMVRGTCDCLEGASRAVCATLKRDFKNLVCPCKCHGGRARPLDSGSEARGTPMSESEKEEGTHPSAAPKEPS